MTSIVSDSPALDHPEPRQPAEEQLGLVALGPAFVLNVLGSAASSLFALVGPLVSMVVFDRIVPHAALDSLALLVSAAVVFVGLDILLRVLRRKVLTGRASELSMALSMRAFEGLMSGRRGAGSTVTMLRDADSVRHGIVTAGSTVLGDGPWVGLFLLVIFILAPARVAAAVLAISIAFLVLGAVEAVFTVRRRGEPAAARSAAARAAALSDGVAHRSLAARLGVLDFFTEKLRIASRSAIDTERLPATSLVATLQPGWQPLVMISVVALGASAAMEQAISMGALIATSIIAARTASTACNVAGALPRLCESELARRHLLALWRGGGREASPVDGEGTVQHVLSGTGTLSVDDVTVKFEEARDVLSGLTFSFQGRRKYVVAGPAGVGKSVLERVLSGQLPADKGRLSLDGMPLQALDPDRRRQMVLSSWQDAEALIGEATLYQNVALGRRVPSNQVGALLSRFGPAGVGLLDHPHALDRVLVSQGETRISSGEVQVVRLARVLAVLSTAPPPRVMIFDDPAAGLDPSSSEAVARTIAELGAKSTVIVLTQQPNLFQLAMPEAMILDLGPGGTISHVGGPA